MNKSLIFLFIVILGCGTGTKKTSDKDIQNIKINDHYISSREVKLKIDRLVRKELFDHARSLMDSLVTMNKENGFLYFERGYVKGQELEFDSAINDFRMAEHLNYSHDKCEKMIFFCRGMLNARK